MAATLFYVSVTILLAGFIWFYVVRPILEDYGIIRDGEGVSGSQLVMSPAQPARIADERTDDADGPSVSADHPLIARLQLDRTKTTVIEVLVYSGWTTAEVRAVLKGENAALGIEVDAARKRLGIDPPDRTLKVRDQAGERVISY